MLQAKHVGYRLWMDKLSNLQVDGLQQQKTKLVNCVH